MALVAQPVVEQDPRCQVGAYVHNGRDMFEVLAEFVPDGETALWLRLQNGRTMHCTDYPVAEVTLGRYFTLVERAPDFPPEA